MNIGIVLAGGFAKGAYQVGALKAIQEFVSMEHIKYISCASIGSLNGYAFAANKLEKAEEIWKGFCDEQESFFVMKLLRGEKLQNIITSLAVPEDKLVCKMYTTVLNINTMKVNYTEMNAVRQHTRKYLRAGIALPMFNRPVKIEHYSYFDGGLVDNIPVYPLMQHKLDYIICIYFDDYWYTFEDDYFDNKIIKIFFPDPARARTSFVVTRENIDNMMESGYERAKGILNLVFENGIEDLDSIYKNITILNAENPKKRIRFTTDTVITGLNKIAKKITKIRVSRCFLFPHTYRL